MHNVFLACGSSKRSSQQFVFFDPLFAPLHDVAAQLKISALAVASRSPAAEATRQPCCCVCEYGATAHQWGASFAGAHFEDDTEDEAESPTIAAADQAAVRPIHC